MSTLTAKRIAIVRERLVPWFESSARDLPWRRTKDPYRIWLSEIMLQQTRVGQAESYYHRFVDKYPTVGELAAADLDGILRDWEGLGYYARARHMHRAAQMIVREMQGQFPDRHEDVMSMPGVGTYTAAAVMSIAYGRPFAVVDGNVIRVISRLFEVDDNPRAAGGKKRFQQLADDLLDRSDPGTFNEAMMELGAQVCLPRTPDCVRCPVAVACAALNSGRVHEFPVRRPRGPVPHHQIAVAVIFDSRDRVFIQRRKENGLLGGLWEFPGGKIENGETARDACRREAFEELGVEVDVVEELQTIDHAYSHFSVTLHPFVCRLRAGRPRTGLQTEWVEIEDLSEHAIPRANRRLIEALAGRPDDGSGRLAGCEVHSRRSDR